MSLDYTDVKRLADSARFSHKGKPIANNTRAMNVGNDVYVIRFHDTNILTYYPDGRTRVTTWDSSTTAQRFREYSRVHFGTVHIPAYKGLAPYPNKIRSVTYGRDNPWIPMGNFWVDANGRIDLSTVSTNSVEVITDRKALRVLDKPIKERVHQLLVRRRLGLEPPRHGKSISTWLVEHLHTPIDECPYHEVERFSTVDRSYVNFQTARELGIVQRVPFKIVPVGGITL